MFTIIAIKQRLTALRIRRLEQGAQRLLFCFDETTTVLPETILAYVQQQNVSRSKNALCRFTPEGHLIVPLDQTTKVMATIDHVLTALAAGRSERQGSTANSAAQCLSGGAIQSTL